MQFGSCSGVEGIQAQYLCGVGEQSPKSGLDSIQLSLRSTKSFQQDVSCSFFSSSFKKTEESGLSPAGFLLSHEPQTQLFV